MTDHLSPARPVVLGDWVHVNELFCEKVTAAVAAETHIYQRGLIQVLSSREMAEYQGRACWHNHVSVSVRLQRRPNDDEMRVVRHDFDMHDAEEDNHQPGRIRNLFLPLHLPRGTVGVCDCKSDETLVVEPDGFQWSRPKSGATS